MSMISAFYGSLLTFREQATIVIDNGQRHIRPQPEDSWFSMSGRSRVFRSQVSACPFPSRIVRPSQQTMGQPVTAQMCRQPKMKQEKTSLYIKEMKVMVYWSESPVPDGKEDHDIPSIRKPVLSWSSH